MTIETIKYRKHTITTHYDQDATCPLDDEGDDIIWAVWERNSIFSDRKYRPVDEPSEMKEWAEQNCYALFPLYKYEHSGVAYSISNAGYPFNCQWDAGQVGYVALKESEFAEDTLYKSAALFAKVMGQWCNGECYGYQSFDEKGEDVGSCWGFIGDDYDRMVNEAKEEIDANIKYLNETLPRQYHDAAQAALD